MENQQLNDFIIVIDTREQDAYKFKGHLTIRDKLDAGDYSIKGFEHEITIERKSHSDFINSISHDRARFKRMLTKMKQFPKKFILVEASFSDIILPLASLRGGFKAKTGHVRPQAISFTKMHSNAILQTIISIMLRYDVIFFFADSKVQAEEFIYSTLKKFYKLKRSGEIE